MFRFILLLVFGLFFISVNRAHAAEVGNNELAETALMAKIDENDGRAFCYAVSTLRRSSLYLQRNYEELGKVDADLAFWRNAMSYSPDRVVSKMSNASEIAMLNYLRELHSAEDDSEIFASLLDLKGDAYLQSRRNSKMTGMWTVCDTLRDKYKKLIRASK